MKRLFFLLIAATMLYAVTPHEACARAMMKWHGSGGWGPKSEFGRMYNAGTVETLKGAIESVERVAPAKGMSPGVHLVVKTEKGTESVHLGPSWFIENQDVKIEAGDEVEITGSRVDFQGKPAVIASEVKMGDQTLELREEDGTPVWAGWRRRG